MEYRWLNESGRDQKTRLEMRNDANFILQQ